MWAGTSPTSPVYGNLVPLGYNLLFLPAPFINSSCDFALQVLMLMSREKLEFLRRERDVWTTLWEKRAARELAEERLVKKCDKATDLRRQCSELEAEARC